MPMIHPCVPQPASSHDYISARSLIAPPSKSNLIKLLWVEEHDESRVEGKSAVAVGPAGCTGYHIRGESVASAKTGAYEIVNC